MLKFYFFNYNYKYLKMLENVRIYFKKILNIKFEKILNILILIMHTN